MPKKTKVKTAAEIIGHRGKYELPVQSLPAEPFRVDVQVLDAKTAFGRTDALVTPIAGDGKAWVDSDRIEIEPNEPAESIQERG